MTCIRCGVPIATKYLWLCSECAQKQKIEAIGARWRDEFEKGWGLQFATGGRKEPSLPSERFYSGEFVSVAEFYGLEGEDDYGEESFP